MTLFQRQDRVNQDCGFIQNLSSGDVWDTYPLWYNKTVGNMFSDGHPFSGRPNGRDDNGGPFWSVNDYNTPGATEHLILKRGLDQYEGSIGIYPPDKLGLAYVDGRSYGPEAYKKMRPAQPEFNLLNFIYELKDLPGMLNQRFLQGGFNVMGSLREAGNSFLAYKFGWESLFRDVGNMVILQRAAQKVLSQLLRDEGKAIRRSTTLLNTTETVTAEAPPGFGYLNPNLPIKFYDRTPSGRLLSTRSDRVWATAKFRYWLPDGPRDINWTMKMLGRIFGGQLTPSVVYNAVPWSWLADWVTSAGDAISNLSDGVEDRLAADYFYVMRERRAENRLELNWSMRSDMSDSPIQMQGASVSKQVHKTRVQGSPFGIFFTEVDLSGMQVAILGALGLSKMPSHL